MTIEERFWAKVRREGDCLIWTGALVNGYGNFAFRGKTRRAHRVAWEMRNGPIPSGLEVHHICKNKACVNVDHLRLLTRLDHSREDGFNLNIARAQATKTHCRRGHPYDEANTYHHSARRHRFCRACHAESERRRRAKARASCPQ